MAPSARFAPSFTRTEEAGDLAQTLIQAAQAMTILPEHITPPIALTIGAVTPEEAQASSRPAHVHGL